MTYRDNVQALCDKLGLVNPIREEDIQIKWLIFRSYEDKVLTDSSMVRATDMNRAGRLFVQSIITDETKILPLAPVREAAATFFTPELWNDCTKEHRPLVYGLKTADTVAIIRK